MNGVIRSKIITIGNSRGIRIPRILLEQVGLEDEVEIMVQDNPLILRPVQKPRQSWGEQFARMAEREDDRLIDEPIPTKWDDEKWTW